MAQRMANYEQERKAIASAPLVLCIWASEMTSRQNPDRNIPHLRSQMPDTNLRQLRRPSSITSVPQREPNIDMVTVRVASREPTEPS